MGVSKWHHYLSPCIKDKKTEIARVVLGIFGLVAHECDRQTDGQTDGIAMATATSYDER